jgi:phosphoribosylglycinamide formyltransferase-1
LASGGGSNLQALIDRHESGDLPAPVVLVISNNSKSGALERARQHAIANLHISSKTHDDPGDAILSALREHQVDVVVLAGYMKLLGPKVLGAFPDRVLNIHPGPLPRFGGQGMYGGRVHEAVMKAGVKTSGPTVFVVTEHYDEGPILGHREVPVDDSDTAETLAGRVLAAEHDFYWRVIRDQFCRSV